MCFSRTAVVIVSVAAALLAFGYAPSSAKAQCYSPGYYSYGCSYAPVYYSYAAPVAYAPAPVVYAAPPVVYAPPVYYPRPCYPAYSYGYPACYGRGGWGFSFGFGYRHR